LGLGLLKAGLGRVELGLGRLELEQRFFQLVQISVGFARYQRVIEAIPPLS